MQHPFLDQVQKMMRFASFMNRLLVPPQPELVPAQIGAMTLEDLLARALSDEWCGVEPAYEEALQERDEKSPPGQESPFSL